MELVGKGMVDSGGGNYFVDNEFDSLFVCYGRFLLGMIY